VPFVAVPFVTVLFVTGALEVIAAFFADSTDFVCFGCLAWLVPPLPLGAAFGAEDLAEVAFFAELTPAAALEGAPAVREDTFF
jgi:hypothetical protein